MEEQVINKVRELIKEGVKRTLRELQKDGVLDCNDYQGRDFDNLFKRIQKPNNKLI